MRFNRAAIRFLFQTYEGMIDRQTWWSGTLALAAILVPLTLIWLVIAPATHRNLSTPQFFNAETLAAFIYLAIFAFAVLLIAVSWTNLSAKRFRCVGRPAALAGAVPFAALIEGAAHWFQPRAPDVFPGWALTLFDAALIVVVAWSIYELGFANSGTPRSNPPHT
ncbi:MAG: hypothetical protein QOH98_502 [Methylobacteriaceae bacterium]|nr:hypothetical protein [Methylobacteriaceae bacterium]